MRAPERALALAGDPADARPDPQRCPRCGAWLHPLSPDLWFCPTCSLLWPPEETKPTLGIQIPLPLDVMGLVGFLAPRPRRYFDQHGNEVLRREP